MERELFSPKSREVAPCTRPKTAAIFNNTQHSTSEVSWTFSINSFFGLPDSLMLLMFSGEFGRAFLELCQQNTTTSWAILAVLLSHRTAYMNPGQGMGGVSYYVTAAVVRCAQVLYTENRQWTFWVGIRGCETPQPASFYFVEVAAVALSSKEERAEQRKT